MVTKRVAGFARGVELRWEESAKGGVGAGEGSELVRKRKQSHNRNRTSSATLLH